MRCHMKELALGPGSTPVCSSVKKAAASLKGTKIHCLVNNASVAAPKGDTGAETADGFEARR